MNRKLCSMLVIAILCSLSVATAKEKSKVDDAPTCKTTVQVMVDIPMGDISFELLDENRLQMRVRNELMDRYDVRNPLIGQAVTELPLKAGTTIKATEKGFQVTGPDGKSFLLDNEYYNYELAPVVDHNGRLAMLTNQADEIGFRLRLDWQYTMFKKMDLRDVPVSTSSRSMYSEHESKHGWSKYFHPKLSAQAPGFMWAGAPLVVAQIDEKATAEKVTPCVRAWYVFRTENPRVTPEVRVSN